MAINENLFQLVRHPLEIRRLEVVQVHELTPMMRRITLGGSALQGFTSLAPEDHIKVFFPAPGQDEPVVPVLGPHGLVPPQDGKPIVRDYSVRRFDAARSLLEIDFFLHEDGGPASSWAAQAAVGQRLAIGGPRGSRVLVPRFDWQLFVGDETALPQIGRRIEELPAETRAIAVIAVNGEREQQSWLSAAPLVVEWVHRPAPTASVAEAYRASLARLLPVEGNGFAWLAGEASEVRAAHDELVRVRGFDKARIRASGLWKRGVSNHDHHEEIA